MAHNDYRKKLIPVTCPSCDEVRWMQNRPKHRQPVTCASCAALGRNKKHGMTKTPLHQVWTAMRQRCINPNDQSYHNYGGRGITVCEEWAKSFVAFYEWSMANGYAKGLQIDRTNNDGNYEPSNGRWVTPVVNARNRRGVKLDETDVMEIKYMLHRGYPNRTIAELFDVHDNTIWSIKFGHHWRNVYFDPVTGIGGVREVAA